MSLTSARTALATALGSVSANVYDHVPAAPVPPFVALVPAAPWVDPQTIGAISNVIVRFRIIAGVAPLDSQAAIINLEDLITEILQNLPPKTVVEPVDEPTEPQVGPSNLLTTNLTVAVTTTL